LPSIASFNPSHPDNDHARRCGLDPNPDMRGEGAGSRPAAFSGEMMGGQPIRFRVLLHHRSLARVGAIADEILSVGGESIRSGSKPHHPQ
jgi:hypothetical protein